MNQAHAKQVRARRVFMDGALVHPCLREPL